MNRKDLVWAGVVLLAVIGCVKFFSIISSILIIGLLAIMFSTIVNRPVSYLHRKGIHRTLATFICMFVIFGIIFGATAIIVPQTIKESQRIKKELPQFQKTFETNLYNICGKLEIDPVQLGNSQFLKNKIEEATPTLINGVARVGANVISVLVHTILIILLMIYILCDPKPLIIGFLDPWRYDYKKKIRKCMLRIENMLFAWAIGLCCGMLCMFLLTWLGLSIIGLDGAFLFAVIAGFMNIIPTLGPFLAAILPVFITLVTKPTFVIWVLLIYIGMHQVESHILTPLIMKKQLAIHPMILILSILVMFVFFGMIGAFITAPIMATLSIIYEEFVINSRKINKTD